MLTIAIIGAGGQIASRIIKRLASADDVKPVAICRSPVTAQLLAAEYGCETRVGDLSAAPSIAADLLRGCTAAVNCSYSAATTRDGRAANARMIANCAAGHGLETFVHLSSIAVYGRIVHAALGSTFDTPRPDTGYGVDKWEMERLVRSRFETARGARAFVLRIGGAYGPGQQTSRDILATIQNPGFRLPFAGERTSNCIHVDVLAATIHELTRSSAAAGTYNVADVPATSLGAVFGWHCGATGLPMPASLDAETATAEIARHVADARRGGAATQAIAAARAGVQGAIAGLTNAEALRQLVARVGRHSPRAFLDGLRRFHGNRAIGHACSPETTGGVPPGFLGEAMPGPHISEHLSIPLSTAEAWSSSSGELKEWFERYSRPSWPSAVASMRQHEARV